MRQRLLCLFTFAFIFYRGVSQIPSGEVLWLSADKNVVKDTKKRVSEWPDRSGNGNSVFQLDSLYQPKWVKNVFGTKPAIFFNGVHGKYFLSNSTSDLTIPGGARTVFVMGLVDSVAKANGGGDFPSKGGTMFTFKRGGHIFAVQAARVNTSLAQGDYVYTGGIGTYSNATAAGGKFYKQSLQCSFIDVFISSGSGSYIRVRQNGDSIPVVQSDPIVYDDGITGFTVGDREDFIGQDWQGYIAEIIVYNRELNSSEIVQTESYLSTKYSQCFSLSRARTSNDAAVTTPAKLTMRLYPNPATDNLMIDELPSIRRSTLRITDITGRVIMTSQVTTPSFTWNISSLASGTYFLVVESDGNSVSKEFVKQ